MADHRPARPVQQQRLARLQAIAAQAGADQPNADYGYEEVAERLAGRMPLERFVAVREDESYAFLDFADSLEQVSRLLADAVGEPSGNRPVAAIDLDTGASYRPEVTVRLCASAESSWYLQ